MVSVKNEINDILLNTINDLEKRLDESRTILTDIQEKMDSKVSEAKEYKVSVDDAKEKIKTLEEEIRSLENDLIELKEKYGKKNLVAVIEAGTKEINLEIKKKQDEIQVHKNKIAELTNRARSIKDLLLNLKKDKKIKEERLEELESCTKYYKVRLEEVIEYSDAHDDLEDYFVSDNNETASSDSASVFEDIVGFDEQEDNVVEEEETKVFDEVSIAEADEVFNEVINSDEEDKKDSLEETELVFEDSVLNEEVDLEETDEEDKKLKETDELLSISSEEDEESNIQFNDLITNVKEPLDIVENNEKEKIDKIDNINKAIDDEFENIFGKSINEPIKTMDIFGNEYVESEDEESDIVNKLTNIGLDYYSFTESDRNIIKDNFNEQTIKDIVDVLNNNKIQVDNVYVDGSILSNIAPSELSNIVNKLISCGQSADAIGYVLDRLPLVDAKKLDTTINNYGDYIKNVDIADIIVKSLKGDN